MYEKYSVVTDYYCYVLTVDGKPFYVGQGRGQRWQFHEWHAHGSKSCKHGSCNFIRNAETLGHFIEKYKSIENLTKEEALEQENSLIRYGIEQGWPLVNRKPSGPKGRKWTREERIKRTKSITEAWQNKDLIQKQRERQLKRWSDPEEIEKQKERMNDPSLVAVNSAKNKGNTRKALTYPGFVSPEGKVYSPVHNLSLFCAEHGLQKSNMCLVANKKQPAHKGWTLYQI